MSFETVTFNFTMALVDGDFPGYSFPAAFIWTSEDPVVFSLGMHPSPGEYVDWTLGRELLKAALEGEEGHTYGQLDTQWLKTSDGKLWLRLDGGRGEARTLEMTLTTAREFMASTEMHVKVGEEDLSADVDYAILMMLG